jgi:hypothetical protein
MASQNRHWHDVDYQMAVRLDLPHRLAWATEVVSQVLDLFSPHFREKYFQRQAVDFARRFYRGEVTSDDERRSIIHNIEDLVEEAEGEGYSRNHLAPGVHLLIEIETDDGKGCTNAVDYASVTFASYAFFAQGVTGTGMPVEYADLVANKVYAFAWTMFCLVSQHEGVPASSIPLSQVQLDTTFPLLPTDVIQRSKRSPPSAEIISRPKG